MNEAKTYYTVIEHIQTLIQQGKISLGGKLPSERQLSATLGLSRNSIREALRSLENMGIVESRHGLGNFLVNHVSQNLGSTISLLLFMNACSSQEVSQLRCSIEISAYLLAIKQVQDTQIQELSRCFDALKNSSLQERAELDKQFHDTLIQFSGNRMFILLNETLSQLFEHTIQTYQTHLSPNTWEQLLSYHARILSCLALRAEEGIYAITEHYDFISSEKTPTSISGESNNFVSVGVHSPTEIKASGGLQGRGFVFLSAKLTRAPQQERQGVLDLRRRRLPHIICTVNSA